MLNDNDDLLEIRTNSLTYAGSRLSAKIVPQDLTNFKTSGISNVERTTDQKIKELHQNYLQIVNEYNINKFVYESLFNFEPIIGNVYHIYYISDKYHLSMIEPNDWHHTWIGSFRLITNGQWQVENKSSEFDYHLQLLN